MEDTKEAEAVSIDEAGEEKERPREDITDYIARFARNHNITAEKATQQAIVKEVIKQYLDPNGYHSTEDRLAYTSYTGRLE